MRETSDTHKTADPELATRNRRLGRLLLLAFAAMFVCSILFVSFR